MKNFKLSIMALLGVIALTACSDAGSSSSFQSCPVFGDVPGIYADYEAQRDKIEESAQNSEEAAKAASAKIDELKVQYRAKIEEAGKKLNGQPIEIAPSEDFKVAQPISLTFKEFANGLNSAYDVAGEVEAATDVALEVSESWLKSHDLEYLNLPLLLVGCDEQGAEVTSTRIGVYKGFKEADGKVILPAGTKAELQTTYYNNNDYENYLRVKSVKLLLDTKSLQ
ncbi:MAG: hypothetical protein ACI4AK_03290 [Lepagella sp.]